MVAMVACRKKTRKLLRMVQVIATLAVFVTVATLATLAAGHDRCEGSCDVQNLLQKFTASNAKLELQLDAASARCNFEEPWPCGVEALKFAPLQVLNDRRGTPCEDQVANISVLNISGGGYTPVCRVQGYCLNACSISTIDNFLYCQADNALPETDLQAARNSLVRITCPGLSSVTSFNTLSDPVDGRVCYVGGGFGFTVAASFDLDGSYYWREGNSINKLTDASLNSFNVSSNFISDTTTIPSQTELIKTNSSFNDLLDFVVVKQNLLGAGIGNYLVGCGRREVVIQDVSSTSDPTVLAMTLTDGTDTGNAGSGAQWYYHGTPSSFCAYNNGGVVSVLFNEINLVNNSVLGALVSPSEDTFLNDGMNCLLADPAPFPPPDQTPCPNGEEEFTFVDSPTGQLAVNQSLSDNIFVKEVDARDIDDDNLDCLGAAILTTQNAAASAIPDQTSGAPLLIFSSKADNASGKVGPCDTGSGDRRPRITLGFYQPVDIVSFEVWNNFGATQNNRAQIFWRSGGNTGGILNTLQGSRGGGQTVTISGAERILINVTEFQVRYGNLPGLKSFRFCRQGGSGVGDPHIHTMDGHHYTLLRQGTFLLWSFSHHTQIPSHEAKSPVDWQLYAHYSGHASYTKGLLLLDSSVPSAPHALELLASDCKWRSRKGKGGYWTPLEKPELLMVQTGADYVTGMNVLWNTSSAKDYQLVKLNMNSLHGIKQMATLHISCRPNHNINTAIVMERAGDSQFVQGQIGVTSKRHVARSSTSGMSALQTAQDQEFLSKRKWSKLGGSSEGAMYLNSVDEEGASFTQRSCSDSEKADASKICTKHLGKPKHHEMETFADCVYDVCTGGGDVAAQLMAVVMKKSKE